MGFKRRPRDAKCTAFEVGHALFGPAVRGVLGTWGETIGGGGARGMGEPLYTISVTHLIPKRRNPRFIKAKKPETTRNGIWAKYKPPVDPAK